VTTTYFGQPVVSTAAQSVSPGTFLVALAGGLAGGLFSRLTLIGVSGLPSVLGKLRERRPALFAGLCGLVIALIGAVSGGLTYGTGYAEARSILEDHVHLPWFYAPTRALATLAASLSGVPAGLLAPSLSVGAGLGQLVADLSGQVTAIPFAILGMCGYLAGVTQAPLTSPRHRDGNDYTACYGATVDDHGRGRDYDFKTSLTPVVSNSGGSLRRLSRLSMKTIVALAVAVLFLPWAALAQAPPGVARGVIVAIEGDTLTLKLADGSSEKVALGKDWKVSVLKPVSVDTIQPGSFIGTAEMPQKDGHRAIPGGARVFRRA